MDKQTALERLRALDRERMHLVRSAALLQWDQETGLPPEGVEDRAEQLAVLEGLAHEKLVNPELGQLLEVLEARGFVEDPPAGTASFPGEDFLRVLRRDYERAVKLPVDFVRECARTEGLSQAVWVKARRQRDFSLFAPHLEKMVRHAQEKTRFWGWGAPGSGTTLYDGLLDLYEPDLSAGDMAAVFGPLGERLSALLQKITAAPEKLQGLPGFLHGHYNPQKQDAFCRELLQGLGFDFNRGRLDCSAHPFTSTLGFNDVRITTRYAAEDPMAGLLSVVHEAGHAFYEMALDPLLRSSCLGEGTSMGIHESQSRLWENVIGRSRSFWRGWFPRFREFFPEETRGRGVEDLYRELNRVRPSLIRVEADEVSYSLHIILRFELEQGLIGGALTVNELPAAWNAAMKKYLGLSPADDADGVLQDIHWSMGAFGYFPSYALGNLYGLQLWEKLGEDLPGMAESLERRDYGGIHRWLGEKIYRRGRRVEPARLIEEATGKPLSSSAFLGYIEKKYSELYEL
ncbi:MAG: carboxypeptidase M32 [Treponema sp.]|jgi:carboxypeptidase Taq|nr:carboxypeptidase M32 [Treponema sp.]